MHFYIVEYFSCHESALATGWTAEGSDFEYRYRQAFSPLHVVPTGSGAYPASYQKGTGGSFPRGKAIGA
jgi:hypothetical protein